MMRFSTDGMAKRPALSSPIALLIVDVQNYTAKINEGCEYFTGKFSGVKSNIAELASIFRATSGCEVIFTYLQSLTPDRRDISVDYKLSGPSLCQIPGPSDGDLFLDDCQPMHGRDILLPKTSCSVFHSTNLHYVLSNLGIRDLVIVGQLTDQCVTSAARGAADLGYCVTVVVDACVARSLADEERGRANVAGFARLLSTADVVEEMRVARSQEQILVDRIVDLLQEKGFHEAAQVVLGEFGEVKGAISKGSEERGNMQTRDEDPVFEMVPRPSKEEGIDMVSDTGVTSILPAGDSPVMVGMKKEMWQEDEEVLNTRQEESLPLSMVPQMHVVEETEGTDANQVDQQHEDGPMSTQMASNETGMDNVMTQNMDFPSVLGPVPEQREEDNFTSVTPVTAATSAAGKCTDDTKTPDVVASTHVEASKREKTRAEVITGAVESTPLPKTTAVAPLAMQRSLSDPPSNDTGDVQVDESKGASKDLKAGHDVATARAELEILTASAEATTTKDESTIVPLAIQRIVSDPPTENSDHTEDENKWNAALVSAVEGGCSTVRDPPTKPSPKKQDQLKAPPNLPLKDGPPLLSPSMQTESTGEAAVVASTGRSLISDIGQNHPCDSFIGTSATEHGNVDSFLKIETTDEAKVPTTSEKGAFDAASITAEEEKRELQMPPFEAMMEAAVTKSPESVQGSSSAGAAMPQETSMKHGTSTTKNAQGVHDQIEATNNEKKPAGLGRIFGKKKQTQSGDAKRPASQRRMVDPPASKTVGKSFIGKQFL